MLLTLFELHFCCSPESFLICSDNSQHFRSYLFKLTSCSPTQTCAIRSHLPSCYYTFSHGGYTSRHTQKCISPCLFRRIICPLNKISGMCCLWLFFNARNLYALVGPILYACLLTTRQHGLPPPICLEC